MGKLRRVKPIAPPPEQLQRSLVACVASLRADNPDNIHADGVHEKDQSCEEHEGRLGGYTMSGRIGMTDKQLSTGT